MKKTIKTLAMFSTLFALTACQDLGRQLTKEEGEAIYADIQNHNLTKMPEVFTLNEKFNYSSYVADFTDKNGNQVYGSKANTILNYYACYNAKKNYYHDKTVQISEETAEGLTIKTETINEDWRYFEKGKFYTVNYSVTKSNLQSANVPESKTYDVDESSEADAKTQIIGVVDPEIASSLASTKPNEYADVMLSSIYMGVTFDTTKLNRKSTIEYYSKNESNLSIIAKDNTSFGPNAVSFSEQYADYTALSKMTFDTIKYNFSYKVTVDKYCYGTSNLNVNSSVRDEDNKELMNNKVTAKYKLEEKSSVSYPDLKNYKINSILNHK